MIFLDRFIGPQMYQVRLPKIQSLWVLWLNVFGRNSPEIIRQMKASLLLRKITENLTFQYQESVKPKDNVFIEI